MSRFEKLLSAIEHPGLIRALVEWPKFSFASFLIVSRLKELGIRSATVIDVGANIGQFAIAAAKLFEGAQVVSIEPDPHTAALLRKNVQRLPVSVIESALSDQCGKAEFFVNKNSQVSSLLPLGADRQSDFPASTVVETIGVPTTTLDALFKDRSLAHPILLKLDVQGFEDRVLRGAADFLDQVQYVVFEVAFGNLYEGEADFSTIAGLLEEKGFRFLRPLNFHTSPKTGQIIEMDALFARDSTERKQ